MSVSIEGPGLPNAKVTNAGGGGGGGGGPTGNTNYLNRWVDSNGNFWIADEINNAVREVTASSGDINTVAGTGGAPEGYTGDGFAATSATLYQPVAVAVDSSFNLYIADTYNNVIREVDASTGIITTIVGIGGAGNYSGDGFPAISAQLNAPSGLAVNSAGDLYISDSSNNVIRKVTASTGIITTVAGNGTAHYSGDGGVATAATLDGPMGIALDSSGNLYIADASNGVVREVYASGMNAGKIATIAGDELQSCGGSYTDGSATGVNAQLCFPNGVTVDSSGNVYIAEIYGNGFVGAIRKVSTAGTISTITPTGTPLSQPTDVALDSSGNNLYVFNLGEDVFSKVNLGTSVMTTVAGNGTTAFSGDGMLAVNAELYIGY